MPAKLIFIDEPIITWKIDTKVYVFSNIHEEREERKWPVAPELTKPRENLLRVAPPEEDSRALIVL
jgi:hypothetical protein